jgi:hypothetical protein
MFDVQPRPVKGPPVRGLAALVVIALLLVAGGAVAFAAGPSQVGQSSSAEPSASASPASPNASTAPGATQPPAGPGQGGMGSPGQGCMRQGFGYGRRGGGQGGPGAMASPGNCGPSFPGFTGRPGRPGGQGGRGPIGGFIGGFIGGLLGDATPGRTIQITAVNGNNLSLATNDGWTRTVDDSSATVTRDGSASTAADLKVGDAIQLREQQNSDGTWTVTAINVVQPRVTGTVQSLDDTSITLSHLDGSTTVVHVSSTTTFQVIGVTNPTLADIKVGNVVEATGTLNNDGSLDATSVVAFNGSMGGGFPRFPWANGGPMGPNGGPNASPSPSSPAANG